ncbi:transposable element Tcb1 transposase [Trichonephila clavipes]|nr:transposable element Tcb1 transposase [Trichonephila clavipes]
MKEGCGWQSGMKLSLLTSHASVCNTTMVGFESGATVERRLRIAGILNSQRYISEVLEPVFLLFLLCLATSIFQQHNAQPHVARIVQSFFINHQIELLPWPARSPDLLSIENMWSMFAQRLTQITPPAATPDQLCNVWKLLALLYPKNTSKVSLNQCRGVWQR